uniref:Uncharacterized protein n=1 Tax=Myotis myotis TaxID=51298 RepID=A0A7J7ZYI0_MYOMY|nr:hypothetical protein mMyoMyo1_009949 [Myotis myotis]
MEMGKQALLGAVCRCACLLVGRCGDGQAGPAGCCLWAVLACSRVVGCCLLGLHCRGDASGAMLPMFHPSSYGCCHLCRRVTVNLHITLLLDRICVAICITLMIHSLCVFCFLSNCILQAQKSVGY